ncbi:MAG TPA: hypothetical protein VK427_12300 [Kofleriaceae bacterium]|nr:hypothetical protein [Kofleriaceae bacterium]
MTQLHVLLPVLVGAVACSVGEYGESMNSGDGGPGTNDRDTWVPKVATPAAPHNHAASGAGDTPQTAAGSRKGVGCLAAGGCHGAQPGSSVFTFAGTAYTAMAGTAPAAGVTVRLFVPGTKKSIAKAVTDADGNFYTSAPVTFPSSGLETDVTGCGSTPDIIPMISPIRVNEANCSSSGNCHLVPGVAAPRAIYLP